MQSFKPTLENRIYGIITPYFCNSLKIFKLQIGGMFPGIPGDINGAFRFTDSNMYFFRKNSDLTSLKTKS